MFLQILNLKEFAQFAMDDRVARWLSGSRYRQSGLFYAADAPAQGIGL